MIIVSQSWKISKDIEHLCPNFTFYMVISQRDNWKYQNQESTEIRIAMTQKTRVSETLRYNVLTRDAFRKLRKVLSNRKTIWKIDNVKKRLLSYYVISKLSDVSECLTISSKIKKKLEVTKKWLYRRMLSILWTEFFKEVVKESNNGRDTYNQNESFVISFKL